MATAALALVVGACTIEDTSEKRAADSAAAATAKGSVETSASGGAMASPQPGPGTAQTTPGTGSMGAPATGAAAAGTPARQPLARQRRRRTHLEVHAAAPREHRVEVDVNARRLTVFDGDKTVGSYRIAVGSKEWPTQTGEWSITQVVWNPEWVPPKDEAWAKTEEPKAPGAADNPLGRAQLVYDPPRTIHGTNEPQSIGKAVSHGSIRLANADVTKIARQLMEATGVQKDEAWYRQVQQNRTEKVPVDLPQRVAIRVF